MKKYHKIYNFTHVPGVFKRGQQALILIENDKNKFLLGEKNIYPNNIVRMIGGGIEADEDPDVGAVRELKEETGLKINRKNLKKLAEFEFEINDLNTSYFFQTHLYYLNIGKQRVVASDDIDGIAYLNKQQLEQLIKNYQKLSNKLFIKNNDRKKAFKWRDYGEIFGFIHQVALDEYNKLSI